MTTNRVTSFDIAMLSRIHWPINFGNMKVKHEIDIWKKWIEKLKAHNEKLNKNRRIKLQDGFKDSAWFLREWGKNEENPAILNGREIRNIFVAAYTKADGGIVKWEHVMDFRDNIVAFRNEMRDTRIKTEGRLLVGGD